MSKGLFNKNNSNVCFIIALICLWFQYKDANYKFIMLFSVLLLIGSFLIDNTCRIIIGSLLGAFSLTYITTTINSNLVIKEGLAPSSNDFMECYPVGEQDAKYIENGYEVSVGSNGSIEVSSPVTANPTPGVDLATVDFDAQFNKMLNQILTSPIIGFGIGAVSAYLVYMVGKRVWDSSIKNCINKPII